MDSGVYASLHPHSHHQIVLANFDLKVFYLPLYERTMWHFSQANSDGIDRTVDLFDWESALTDLDVNERVPVFNDTITKIMSNFWWSWPSLDEDICGQMINILEEFQSDTEQILAASFMW